MFENSPFQGCLRVKAKVNFVTKETRDLLNRLSQQQKPFDVKDAFSINFNDILNSEIYNKGYTKTLPELKKNIKAKQIGINFLLS